MIDNFSQLNADTLGRPFQSFLPWNHFALNMGLIAGTTFDGSISGSPCMQKLGTEESVELVRLLWIQKWTHSANLFYARNLGKKKYIYIEQKVSG